MKRVMTRAAPLSEPLLIYQRSRSLADTHPIDVADVPPPPWLDQQRSEACEKARQIYCQLCNAAGVERDGIGGAEGRWLAIGAVFDLPPIVAHPHAGEIKEKSRSGTGSNGSRHGLKWLSSARGPRVTA